MVAKSDYDNARYKRPLQATHPYPSVILTCLSSKAISVGMTLMPLADHAVGCQIHRGSDGVPAMIVCLQTGGDARAPNI